MIKEEAALKELIDGLHQLMNTKRAEYPTRTSEEFVGLTERLIKAVKKHYDINARYNYKTQKIEIETLEGIVYIYKGMNGVSCIFSAPKKVFKKVQEEMGKVDKSRWGEMKGEEFRRGEAVFMGEFEKEIK